MKFDFKKYDTIEIISKQISGRKMVRKGVLIDFSLDLDVFSFVLVSNSTYDLLVPGICLNNAVFKIGNSGSDNVYERIITSSRIVLIEKFYEDSYTTI